MPKRLIYQPLHACPQRQRCLMLGLAAGRGAVRRALFLAAGPVLASGGSWRQTHVAGPTGLRTAPLLARAFVGEYQELAGLRGHGFAAIFTMAAPLAKDGPTDIFFARIEPGR